MYLPDKNLIWAASADQPVCLLPGMANRHGLIAGATGTGKTVTLKVLAEGFSDAGVPVFLGDVKGDVSGLAKPGVQSDSIDQRLSALGISDFTYSAYPVRFWDVYGKQGIPVRTTISAMGPDLLARILGLNDVQSQVLSIVFKIADDSKLLLIDTKDLKSMLTHVSNNAATYQPTYGAMSTQTLATIQRNVVQLEGAGGETFFGEPALDINDWLATDTDGRGIINILSCVQLVQNPLLYSTFLLWMLSDLYETLPEAGDLAKPKIVFFFDEAHLLFQEAPKALLSKVEQVARLVRSKGVGIYFITQVPSDVPDNVLSQLGNKVQHALRAYTPSDQKAAHAAAQGFRPNPAFDTEKVLGELGIGEVLVSLLDDQGVPGMVERAKVLPPRSFLGVADDALINQSVTSCPLYPKYATAVDDISAYEVLTQQDTQAAAGAAPVAGSVPLAGVGPGAAMPAGGVSAAGPTKAELAAQKQAETQQARAQAQRQTEISRVVSSTVSSVGREVGRQLVRGLFGNLLK